LKSDAQVAPARQRLRLSVVVPAYNEAKLIESCLSSITESLDSVGVARGEYEIIVVDNASTDDTAPRALSLGARLIHEPVRQIARARNAGAGAASGEWLVFLDADSWPDGALFADLLETMQDSSVVGGGSTLRMDGLPWSVAWVAWLWKLCSRTLCWAAGALVFCRRDAFRAVNGFDDSLFVGEEINLSRKLKAYARWRGMRFVILSRNPLRTSSRKADLYSGGEIWLAFGRMARHPWRFFHDPSVCSLWYDGRR
jgi:glycosyltransferase involved in cell wall biosynthesis